MSDLALANIAAALATLLDDKIANQINRSTVMLNMVPVGNGPGKNLTWAAKFGSAVGAKLADGADQAVFNSDTKVPATLEYGTYTDAFGITGKALSAALNTRNPADLENLFQEELGDSVKRLAKGISQAIYLGDGTTDAIMGLCDPTAGALLDTGSYAGVSRSTYPQWASNVDDNGGVGRAISFDLMRAMRTAIYTASGEMPDLIVTTPQIHGRYAKLFESNRKYFQDVTLRGSKINLSGGFGALFFDEVIPVIQDVDCPAGQMLFLNTSNMNMAQLPDPSAAITQAMGTVGLVGDAEEQFGAPTGKISARINPLARLGDKYRFQLICYPQLRVRQANSMGRIIDIDYTL